MINRLIAWLFPSRQVAEELPAQFHVDECYHVLDEHKKVSTRRHPLTEQNILNLLRTARNGDNFTRCSIELRLEQAMDPSLTLDSPEMRELDRLYCSVSEHHEHPTPALAQQILALMERRACK